MVQTQSSEKGSVYHLADDPTKNIVIFINDWYEEYGAAFYKLQAKLGRQLRGIMLINKKLKEQGRNLPDPTGNFEEIVCDFSNDADLRSAVRQLENNLLLVSCSSERSQMDFQRVLPHLPYLPNPSERSLEWATHKGKMRELIGAYNNKLVPKVQPVNSAKDTEISKVLEKLSFPMIIKPTGLSDSTLVTKVHNVRELQTNLRNAFDALHETYRRNRGNGEPGIIIEEFMEGDLYSIDGYVNESGKIWLLPLLRSMSAYHMGLEGFYIYSSETFHELSTNEAAAGKQAAEDAMRAIGLRSSIAHIELYNTDDGWKIIEIAARPGAMRQEMYEVSYGVDHALNELLVKIGLPPEMERERLTNSMVFKIYPESEGTVASIDGLHHAHNHPSMYKVFEFAKPGDTVRPITNGGSVAAQFVFTNIDVRQLRQDVADVRSKIKVTTEQPATTKTPTHVVAKKHAHTAA